MTRIITRIELILGLLVILAISNLSAAATGDAVFQSASLTNEELLATMMRLEGRFEREMNKAQNQIDQLSKELSEARGRIDDLERREGERFIDLKSHYAAYIKSHEVAADADNNNQSMTQPTASAGDEWNRKSYLMPRSCAEARSADPTLQSGNYYVDPDGTNIGDDPINVYCDMTTGATLVGHDSEATIDVGNCNDPGCYSKAIKYSATTKQLAALVDVSSSCRQSIRYDCFGAPFEFNGVQDSWWNDRNGAQRYFWAGANTNNNQHTCQCGIDKNCIDSSTKCNCDALAFVQVNDNGYVTEKSMLPVTRLNFGRIAPGASGKHTLGKFECSGRTTLMTKPTSCYDLFIAGNQISGFYTVKGSATKVSTVYCDFSKSPGATDYETLIGFNDIKTSTGVYFYVQRSSVYATAGTVIPYEIERLNIGGAMNLATGVFTAPVNGRYFFSFTALSWKTNTEHYLSFRVNGASFGTSYAPVERYNMPISATLNLKIGDKVDMWLSSGTLDDNGGHYTHFSGILLEEDLTL